MSKLDNTLAKAPEMVMSEHNLFKVMNEAWALRHAKQPDVPFFCGPPGMAKTQLMYAWGAKMREAIPDFFVCDVMTADKYPSDIVAQIPNHEDKVLSGYVNEVLAWAIEPEAKGLIFLDEITQAMADTQKVISKIINERKLGQFPLAPNVILAMAGNRSTDKARAIKLFSMISNRANTINCIPDVEGVIDYMIDQNYNPLIAAYMSSAPYVEERDFQPNDASFYTHRSMERVAQKWTLRDPDGAKGVVMSLLDISSSIGIGRAREFLAFAEMVDKMPGRKEILNNPEGCKVPVKLDEQCAVCCMLTTSAAKDVFPKYAIYMQRFPVSLQILFLKLVHKRGDQEIRKLKELVNWILKPEIKAAIMDRMD